VNAYEGKAGVVYLQVKLCDPCLSALRYAQCIKWRYINTLPLLSDFRQQSTTGEQCACAIARTVGILADLVIKMMCNDFFGC